MAMRAANRRIEAAWTHPKNSPPWWTLVTDAKDLIAAARTRIESARNELLKFLRTESPA